MVLNVKLNSRQIVAINFSFDPFNYSMRLDVGIYSLTSCANYRSLLPRSEDMKKLYSISILGVQAFKVDT